jgi:X-Pro dipeptidyl-peptidase
MTRHTVLAVLLLLGVPLAGCVTPAQDAGSAGAGPASADGPSADGPDVGESARYRNLSEAVHAVRGLTSEYVPTSDGETLHAAVALPEMGPSDTVPVVVNYSPYFSNAGPPAMAGGDQFSTWLVNYLVPRGYAVVIQSVRGTGDSSGCFEMGGDVEQRDTYQLVEHWANKSWSNGQVGLVGKSYDGTTANVAGVMDPPSLETIVPVAAISEWYNYLYKGGVPYDYGLQQGATFNARYWALVDLGAAPYYRPTATLQEGNVENAPDSICPEVLRGSADGVRTAYEGSYSDYWAERSYLGEADEITVPTFLVHGLQDWNVKPDQMHPFYERIDAPKKAWLGQWDHVYPNRTDWNRTLLAWFDRWLKDEETGVMDEPAVQVQDSAGTWRHEATWPPDRATDRTLYLQDPDGEVGTLGSEPAEEDATGDWVDDPTRPPDPPTSDPSYATWATGARDEPLRVSGEPTLTFQAVTDRPSTQFVALLYEVDDRANWEVVNYGFLDARHREGIDDPQPVVPGQAYTYETPLFPMDHVVEPGHKLGLVLTSSYPPMVTTEGTAARNVVQLGADPAAQLTLPAIEAIDAAEEQPTMVPPDAVPGN